MGNNSTNNESLTSTYTREEKGKAVPPSIPDSTVDPRIFASHSSPSPVHLKRSHFELDFPGRSDRLVPTPIPYGQDVRSWYLADDNMVHCPPPVISASEFVPPVLVEHLMRCKKLRAIGVKFVDGNDPPDIITNMEGALHTFVTPVVPALLHGDYAYRGQHMMLRFPPTTHGYEQARQVVVSALVQPDFEDDQVMATVAALRDQPSKGANLPPNFAPPSIEDKQHPRFRAVYDFVLRAHMIYHLVADRYLPSLEEVQGKVLSIEGVIDALERWIRLPDCNPKAVQGAFFYVPSDQVLSLELLYNSALHQMRNELSALEAFCTQGYVYTFDPPAIFARIVPAELLNRLLVAALKLLSKNNTFSNMRVFAFNDYADPDIASTLLPIALAEQKHIEIMRKADLFPGADSSYLPPVGSEGALLVLHNNSDAFGQNIETELLGGSMDGCIGSYSSVAASLRRDRLDLVKYIM